MGDVTQVPVGDRIMKLQERVHELEHVVETLQQQVRDLEAAQRAW
jgi:polyhydroxyalkanoate synthesis regulator phasin